MNNFIKAITHSIITAFFFVCFLSFELANASPSNNLCLRAITQVSRQTGVPYDVLTAVALTETGTKRGKDYEPWPWAINVEGKGYMFKTRDEAIQNTMHHIYGGKTSVDLGCMQMNWRWHKGKFGSSIVKAFDPYTNVSAAATFLKSLYQQTGNWMQAIGRYHSGTYKFAKIYMAKASVNRNLVRKRLGIAPIMVASYELTKPIKPIKNIKIASVDKSLDTPKNTIIVPQDNLPQVPELQQAFLDMTPGALIDFEQVGEPLIKLPDKPIPLYSESTGSIISLPKR